MTRTATEILKSLVADVEAMRTPPIETNELIDNPEYEPENWFGGFDVSAENDWESGIQPEVHIEWPNLAILIDEAKEALRR